MLYIPASVGDLVLVEFKNLKPSFMLTLVGFTAKKA
jgi:hypothetical protein